MTTKTRETHLDIFERRRRQRDQALGRLDTVQTHVITAYHKTVLAIAAALLLGSLLT